MIALLGLGGGVGAGIALRPEASQPATVIDPEQRPSPEAGSVEYVRLNNQFIVPVLEGERVASLVALSLSLEVAPGSTELIYAKEPKLRDVFLQVLFDHANTGGFRGSFTDASNLISLRKALHEEAILVMGPVVTDVLITEIARQDG